MAARTNDSISTLLFLLLYPSKLLMARSKKSKPKPGPRANRNSTPINLSPPYEAPPSSPIATLRTDPDCDGASLNQQFPLSCARDEPATKPLLELPSTSRSPPKRGKKSRCRKARCAATFAATTIQSAELVQDQENMLNNSSSTYYRVIEKAKSKRKKIQVQSSFRVLRPRRCKPTVNRGLLVGDTSPSAMRLIQDKPNDDSEIDEWKASSWDKWSHVRGTIRRPK